MTVRFWEITHSMHHSSSVYFICCTLPPSTHLNPSQQHHSYFICSTFHKSLCTLCMLYAQSFYMLSPRHCSLHQDVHCHSTLPPLHSVENQHSLSGLHVLLVSSPLPDHHGNSSSFLAVIPMHSSSLGVIMIFDANPPSRQWVASPGPSRSAARRVDALLTPTRESYHPQSSRETSPSELGESGFADSRT
jgi:hypothetical protein